MEPIERAIVDPISRGYPRFEDDLYYFGVSLAMILRSYDPVEGMSDDDIIKYKMEKGSFSTLIGSERFSASALELLRGLLMDDRSQRWELDEVLAWMEGQRLNPIQPRKRYKASRPLVFNDRNYINPATLALDLEKYPSEAVKIIEGGELLQWLERSLDDEEAKEDVASAIVEAKKITGSGYTDALLGRVAAVLSPDFPISYKGMKLHPEGIQNALAEAFVLEKDLRPFVEIINLNMVVFWLQSRTESSLDSASFIGKYNNCLNFLKQKFIGYGIERCLYFLNAECPCVSEKLKDYYVCSPEDLLYALEDMSTKKDRPDLFLDRHIVAFLSIKNRSLIDPYIRDLSEDEYFLKVMANVKCVATIQKKLRMGAFPGISNWIADILDPVYKSFHDRNVRNEIKDKVEKLRHSGELSKIAGIISNAEVAKEDMSAFRKAMREYHSLRKEAADIKRKLSVASGFSNSVGRDVSAIFSTVLASIIILVMTVMYMIRGELF
jgi:hypothetical protein